MAKLSGSELAFFPARNNRYTDPGSWWTVTPLFDVPEKHRAASWSQPAAPSNQLPLALPPPPEPVLPAPVVPDPIPLPNVGPCEVEGDLGGVDDENAGGGVNFRPGLAGTITGGFKMFAV